MNQILEDGRLITLVHFTYKVGAESDNSYRIACMPNMEELHQTRHHLSYHRSNDTRAVTCPMCVKTQVFKDSEKTMKDILKKYA